MPGDRSWWHLGRSLIPGPTGRDRLGSRHSERRKRFAVTEAGYCNEIGNRTKISTTTTRRHRAGNAACDASDTSDDATDSGPVVCYGSARSYGTVEPRRFTATHRKCLVDQ